jgi:hypothetical protein
MIGVVVDAVGVVAPGLEDWRESELVLRGTRPYAHRPLSAFASELLPRNERRRATGAIKLAIRAGDEILRQHTLDSTQLRSVFASSAGDGEIIDSICAALALPERAVSPTQFHNSVHNGPAGYWAIATQCRMASASLSAHDGSFAAALMEAATIANVERGPVLLVVYDHPPPPPLSELRHFSTPFATAMLIRAQRGSRTMAILTMEAVAEELEEAMSETELERLRLGNPAARSLPLLRALARREYRRVVLPYLPDTQLAVDVRPAAEG